ncbi:hypothetical protein [Streptomyces sp. NPDC001851]|uniref:hypothetical protein n=1 Tax=Streptomyces sp. NPDC001851 TaxID=3154529 RepID=UPI00331D0A5E
MTLGSPLQPDIELAPAAVHLDGELVDPVLSGLDADAVRDRAPPALDNGVIRLLHNALSIAAKRRADINADPVFSELRS